MAAVLKIFGSSVHHFMTIGAGLEVKTADLHLMAGLPSTKLHEVFQRWFDKDSDVSWNRLKKLCDEFPDELGKAKSELLAYIGKLRIYLILMLRCLILYSSRKQRDNTNKQE